ncbi:MAG: FKBP-type peptidyl-prolyl cis-trans isomerase, partial [Muribaculaceae bacterium]|nr:FKBP-type peptidyl-prolyl cis-trans isomerase [Muribaculaceae bacterium]
VKKLSGGVLYRVINEGNGSSPNATSVVSVYYKGRLINGRIFDDNTSNPCPEPFRLNEVIKGWQIALVNMKVGDKWEVIIPATQGYGSKTVDDIPRNSTLIFEIELVNIF